MKNFTTHYATFGGRIVRVGLGCRMPAGDAGHHTSEGRIADCLLTPCDAMGNVIQAALTPEPTPCTPHCPECTR